MESVAAPLWEFGREQGGRQLAELGLALVLSTLIGLERAVHQKSAGLRTHTLVGVGSALFMEVSQHGFAGVLLQDNISFDPSRVAAQVVSGIGFIGGGLIFVRRDMVRGLTTAATVWLTCAVGMACGGGLALLAVAATMVHFLVVRGYPILTRKFSTTLSARQVEVRLSYRVGGGLLPRVLELCTGQGFRVVEVRVDRAPWKDDDGHTTRTERRRRDEADTVRVAEVVQVLLVLEGGGQPHTLVGAIGDLDGILSAAAGQDLETSD